MAGATGLPHHAILSCADPPKDSVFRRFVGLNFSSLLSVITKESILDMDSGGITIDDG
jgi:hypothetical protein